MDRILRKMRQITSVAAYNFRQWRRNPRIFLVFALAFILCFLLSDKAVRFAREYGTVMQVLEPFVWTFGDANSILLSSLLLVMLFADMPFISPGTPFYLARIGRRTWLAGQALYLTLATGIYMAFILASTTAVCMRNAFIGNLWSETAAVLAYSGAGKAVALPAAVKTLEMSTPYESTGTIFLLMLLYALLMGFIMLTFHIRKGRLAGIVSVFGYSLFGFLLNPQLIAALFRLSKEEMYQANVALGWISPLNHATCHMHNFGYDLLPRLWQSCAIFIVLILFFFLLALRAIRTYNFSFAGTEGHL